MITMGISFGFHDSGVAICRDGEVLAAATEERFSRQKHDSHFPKEAVTECLKQAGLALKDIDRFQYHEKSERAFSRFFTATLSEYPRTKNEFTGGLKSWLMKKLWSSTEISKQLNVSPSLIESSAHHESHAANAFLSSGFNDSAILVADAVGEWESLSLWQGNFENGLPVLTKFHQSDYPHSLGLVYSAMTVYLGFESMESECSVMALAAFGQPVYADQFRRMIKWTAQGLQVDQNYFQFSRFYDNPWSPLFEKDFGSPRPETLPLSFRIDLAPTGQAANPDECRWANIAASLQLVTEEVLIAAVQSLRTRSESQNFCFAGGVALNCVANTKIVEQGLFHQYFIPPDPGDGGSATGAALLSSWVSSSAPQRTSVCLGIDLKENKLGELLKEISPSMKWQFHEMPNQGALLDSTAGDLAGGKVVGWCQGRFENGPRALGARSILARPDRWSVAHLISEKIKRRAGFRPYAMMLQQELASEVFEDSQLNQLADWMQRTFQVKQKFRPILQTALHIDGSTRAQIVAKTQDPLLWQLLDRFQSQTSIPGLLNTSFNESGQPIVSSAFDALSVFARTPIDILVIGRWRIEKQS